MSCHPERSEACLPQAGISIDGEEL